jgi:hypothetical protein
VSISKWKPAITGLSVYTFSIILSLVIAILTGTVFPSEKVQFSLTQDIVYWVSETLIVPLIWGYYTWIFSAFTNLLDNLKQNGAFRLEADLSERFSLLVNKKAFKWIPVIIGALFGGLYFHQWVNTPTFWYSVSPFYLGIRSALVIFPLGYAFSAFIMRFFINLHFFGVASENLIIQPLHPDKAGGLQIIGQYALSLMYLWAVLSSTAVGFLYWQLHNSISNNPVLIYIAFLICTGLAPALFLMPTLAAHRAMISFKKDLLLQVSEQYQKDATDTQHLLNVSAEHFAPKLNKMNYLQDLNKIISNYPEWPYNTDILKRLLLVASSPVITIFIQISIRVIEKYTSL